MGHTPSAALKFLNSRHKKDVRGRLFLLKCRGNLNLKDILLIFIVKNLLKLFLEYILEYCSLDFLNFHLHDVSEDAPTAELQIELSKAAIGSQLAVIDLQLA